MRLSDAQITSYRSIEDSDEFAIEPDVTCLVGKNESGKTAALRALYRLNPVEASASFEEVIDFPAKRSKERKRKDLTELIPVITATFELTDDEAALVEQHFGPEVLTSRQFTLTKGYRQTAGHWGFDFDEQKMLWHLRGRLDLSLAGQQVLAATNTVAQFTEALRTMEDRPAPATVLLEQLDGWGKEAWRCLQSLLSPHLPKFVYFDDYDVMPGKVSIPDLIRRREQGNLTRGEIALLSLLGLAGAELKDFQDTDDHERLVRELENASAGISDEVFKYWSQNKELAVKLHVFQPEIGASAPLHEGPILQIRVENSRHRVSVPFSERSRGFVWFFSFLAYFTELEDTAKEDLILLLDEPGLSLHGRAQEDLLRLIDDRLAPKHQVLYTTHSPFLVSADHLQRVRTVIDHDEVGTKVSAEIFQADTDTAFPLLTAMGIEMTQSLFVGEHTLLLEGPSDLIYLDVLTDVLHNRGRTGLDPRWVKTPIGGSGKLSTFVTLLGANKLHVAVLVDSSTKDVGAVKRLRDNNQLAQGGLLEIGEFTGTSDADIEDLFERDFYLDLVNRAYSQHLTPPITAADLNSHDARIVRQIETYFRDHGTAGGRFDHFKPAATLLREQATLGPIMSEATLTMAENLFKRLNGLLPS